MPKRRVVDQSAREEEGCEEGDQEEEVVLFRFRRG
jgi:hypothetical protein